MSVIAKCASDCSFIETVYDQIIAEQYGIDCAIPCGEDAKSLLDFIDLNATEVTQEATIDNTTTITCAISVAPTINICQTILVYKL